jgi:hypothetical protein
MKALRNLGYTNPLRTVSNSAPEDGELIPSKVPTDTNIGKQKTFKENITEAISDVISSSIPTSTASYKLRHSVKRTASSELLKIHDLEIYIIACSQYRTGLEKGRSKQQLMRLIEEWQEFERRGGPQ